MACNCNETSSGTVYSAEGAGVTITIDALNIGAVHITKCGCSGGSDSNGGGGNGGGGNGGGGGVGAAPPQSVCSGSQNMPEAGATSFTVPAEGWILCHESPKSYNFDTLTIEAGGFIRAVCTALTIRAKNLVIQETAAPVRANPYHIEILGDYGAPGNEGTTGTPGAPGSDGQRNTCSGGTQHNDATRGGTGIAGGTGGLGGTGQPGQSNMPANLYFGNIQTPNGSPLLVFTQSGHGGKGGTGGTGGTGGKGGKGGNVHYCWATCVYSAKDGGTGGSGGTGGNGGSGGPGVNGQDSYIYVKTGQQSLVSVLHADAQPGEAGDPGRGGSPGKGGDGGKKECSNVTISDGSPGSDGSAGASGGAGAPGTVTGSPGVIYVSEVADPLNPAAARLVAKY